MKWIQELEESLEESHKWFGLKMWKYPKNEE